MPVCVSCSKIAKLKCPTCLKQSLPDSWFCSQDCFKSNWSEHKKVHTLDPFNPFPNYPFTGSLRPVYPLSPKRHVPDHIQKPDYADHPQGYPLSEMSLRGSTKIKQLSPSEIEKMRAVCRIGRQVLEEGAKAIRVGITTDEIDAIVHQACIERNAYPSPLNYHGFPKSCCTSVNEVICHGIPDRYALKDGDIINLDISVYYQGMHGDLNATYTVGTVDESGQKLIKATRECLDKSIALCKPGMLYRDLGNIIQKHATANGLSVVKTYCGHGIHEYFHCPPSVPHYSKNKAVGEMKVGHTFTIEPMICEGVWQDETWPDNWTAVTRDGKRSAQFEETLLITETGVEILTSL
jgi:methionyl aminopeptidase